jgi:hypothetical protein
MGYAGGGSLGLTKGFSGPSFGLDAFKGDNGVMGIQGTLGVGWAPPVAYGHSIEAHAARTYTFIGDNIPGRVPLGDFAEGIGINWKLQLRIMQQKMRNRLGNLEQRLRNAQNKILEIENIYEEQIYNVRTQGEAYQWYYTYGLISQLPRD